MSRTKDWSILRMCAKGATLFRPENAAPFRGPSPAVPRVRPGAGFRPVPGFGPLDVASNDLPSLTFCPPTCITASPRKDHSSTRDPDEAA